MAKYKVFCPLNNFNIPLVLYGRHKESGKILRERDNQLADGVHICDDIKLRRVSKEDLDDLKSGASFPFPSSVKLSSNMFVLETHIPTDRGTPYTPLEEAMRNIILAMRLLKKGYVSTSGIFYILISERRQLETWSIEDRSTLADWLASGYYLEFEEIPHLQKLVEMIQGLDFEKRRGIGIACRRLEHTYEEKDIEGKLIDYMIAFEALFLKGKKAPVAGQVIATACSVLLGTNEKEREEIRRSLTKAYALRNRIVHGREYEDQLKDIEISNIEDYLRESMKKFLH